MAGIYVHIPFCGQFCTYCNFYSVKGKEYRDKYIKALHREIESRKGFFKETGVSPRTIYFGGGTPSVFSPLQLGEVLEHIIQTYDVVPQEVSLEVNPNDITREYALQLHQVGFNRVSMGVQSFIDEHLKWMNRRHNAKEGEIAYRNLRDAGFDNISLDLIFGYDGLTPELWEYNLSKIVELSPEHISAYQMSIEPGSVLGKMYERGEYNLPPDSLCHSQYSTFQSYLAENGYQQYEVSNFARRYYGLDEIVKSIHNSSYWTKEPYLGLGPAAHSYKGNIRSWNHPNVTGYCRYYLGEQGKDQLQIWGYEELDARDIFNETIMLGLRKVDGTELSHLNPSLLIEIKDEMKRHIRLGNLIEYDGKIKIPQEKLFVSDGIIRDLFV